MPVHHRLLGLDIVHTLLGLGNLLLDHVGYFFIYVNHILLCELKIQYKSLLIIFVAKANSVITIAFEIIRVVAFITNIVSTKVSR